MATTQQMRAALARSARKGIGSPEHVEALHDYRLARIIEVASQAAVEVAFSDEDRRLVNHAMGGSA